MSPSDFSVLKNVSRKKRIPKNRMPNRFWFRFLGMCFSTKVKQLSGFH